jgi:hypothetical protein
MVVCSSARINYALYPAVALLNIFDRRIIAFSRTILPWHKSATPEALEETLSGVNPCFPRRLDLIDRRIIWPTPSEATKMNRSAFMHADNFCIKRCFNAML